MYIIFSKLLVLCIIICQSACTPKVQVEAPEKPITVNLNVNVEHKLKVQLDKELNSAFKNNPDLF